MFPFPVAGFLTAFLGAGDADISSLSDCSLIGSFVGDGADFLGAGMVGVGLGSGSWGSSANISSNLFSI